MDTIINVKNIKKNYQLGKVVVPALQGVDLDIYKGEFLSIIGPSGSGKTTLMNIIGLIDRPTEGDVFISHEKINDFSDVKLTDIRLNKMGFIFQTFNLIPVLSAVENVEFPLMLQKKLSKKEIRLKALDLLEQVQIKQYASHRPAELSGGQRQRVAIARALITGADIVLADEPTANLDSKTSTAILDLMQSINQKSQTTFIFSTHDERVQNYTTRTVTLIDGKIH